jgi:hypothetical protein
MMTLFVVTLLLQFSYLGIQWLLWEFDYEMSGITFQFNETDDVCE